MSWTGAWGVISELLPWLMIRPWPERGCWAEGPRAGGAHFFQSQILNFSPFSFFGAKIWLIIITTLRDCSLSCQAQHPARLFDVKFLKQVHFFLTRFSSEMSQSSYFYVSPCPSSASVEPELPASSVVELHVDLGVNSGTLSATDNCSSYYLT